MVEVSRIFAGCGRDRGCSGEGIKPIEAMGQVFDPRLHEAVDIDVSGTAAAGVITSELQKGYYYQDEVLRPAKVRVAAAVPKRV